MKNNPEQAEKQEKIANHRTQSKQHQQAETIHSEYQQSTLKDIWAQLEYATFKWAKPAMFKTTTHGT